MSAIEREHVMPPRPLMPWTMALCAGLCASCGLVLNAAADVLLGGRAAPVTLLMAIPVAAAACIVLARFCMRHVRWRRWLYAAALGLAAGAVVSAGWAIGALRASTALDNRAASSLEFVVRGDPSINDGAYSYTCDAYAGEKRLGQVRLSCDRELGAGSHVRAIGRISRFENDAYGRSRVLRGELRKVKVVRLVSIDEGPPGPLSWLLKRAPCRYRARDRSSAFAHCRRCLRTLGRAACPAGGRLVFGNGHRTSYRCLG